MGLNAMPFQCFQTEARKCKHWATGGLLDLDSKLTLPIYMYMKCIFFLLTASSFASENVL